LQKERKDGLLPMRAHCPGASLILQPHTIEGGTVEVLPSPLQHVWACDLPGCRASLLEGGHCAVRGLAHGESSHVEVVPWCLDVDCVGHSRNARGIDGRGGGALCDWLTCAVVPEVRCRGRRSVGCCTSQHTETRMSWFVQDV